MAEGVAQARDTSAGGGAGVVAMRGLVRVGMVRA